MGFRVTGSSREKCLIVKLGPDPTGHNHVPSEYIWRNERKNRLMTADEEEKAKDLLKKHVPVRQVANAVGTTTKKAVQIKDVHNLVTRVETTNRTGHTEGENVESYLGDLKKIISGILIEMENLGTPDTQCITLLTPDMIKS